MALVTNHVAGQVITAADINALASSANGSSLKAIEDASHSILATAPSPESGLTALAANASTDDAPRINAMLQYLKATYGGGRLVLPLGKTSNCNSTITIPAGVQVYGSPTSTWDFWYAGSAVTAVVVNDHDFTPISGLQIRGNQWDANKSSHNTTTSTGISVTGHGLHFLDFQVYGFNWGVDFTNDNTYIINFERAAITNCMVAINLDLSNSWTGGSAAVNNSGERMSFTNCVIANSGTIYWATGEGVGLYFVHTSMDFSTMWGRQQNAHVFFNNCHLETTYTNGLHYMFDVSVNSRLNMVNCQFIMGGTGLYSILNPDQAPWNTGWGIAHFTSCDTHFTMTAAAKTEGAVTSSYSEAIIPVPTGATRVIIASAFVSSWNAVKVNVVATGGYPATPVTARVTKINVPNGSVTVDLSAAAPAGTILEVDF
jgi:hypothetical protein